jgi:hypothetical protein
VRPTSRSQSALRCPLNHILGAEANVRVLRVVLLSDIPIGVSELARLAALQVSGVARVCTRLEDLGVIEAVGRGARHRQFGRGGNLELVKHLTALFSEERAHAERVMEEVREAVRGGSPEVRAAWVEGPVALGTDRPADALVVGVLVEPADVESVRLELWPRLLTIQARGDVVVELRVLTVADLKTAGAQRHAELEQVVLLLGPPPLDLIRTEPPRGRRPRDPRGKRHADLEARSLAIARIIADRIRRDPSLVEDARRHLERRMPSASAGERLELQEWQGVLATMSVSRLRRFLVQDDARARRLRQSSPFLTVLSPDERRAIFTAAERAT